MLARHVDTLVRAEHAIVHHLGDDFLAVVLHDFHVKLTVIEEHIIAHLDVFHKVRVRHTYHIVHGVLPRVADYGYLLACIVFDWRFRTRSPNLWALGVDKYSKVR